MRKNTTKYPLDKYKELYEKEGLSLSQIADIDGTIDESYLGKLLRKYGVKMRCKGNNHGNTKKTHGFSSEATKLGIHERTYIRIKAIEKLGNKCTTCGESDYRVLQINHLDTKEGNCTHKDFLEIINGTYEVPIDLRCANCNIKYEYEKGRLNITKLPLKNEVNFQSILAQPSIYHAGGTQLDNNNLELFMEKLNTWWDPDSEEDGEQLAEVAGRLCYQSWEPLTFNKNVTRIRENALDYFGNILKSGHGSILEHINDSYIIYCSRVCANEIVRHRHASYSQESLRFVRLDQLRLYYPDVFANHPKSKELEKIFKQKIEYDESVVKKLYNILEIDENKDFSEKKELTSAVRRLAPMGLMTFIQMSSNVRNWRHVIAMRTNRHSEEEIRKVFAQIYNHQKEKYPYLYQDSSIELIKNIPEVTFKHSKI